MAATSKRVLKRNSKHALLNTKMPSRIFIHNYAPKEIKEAIVSLHGGNCPLEELIAVAEATFKFIHHADMDTDQKNAFFHLQRLFDFYKNLLRSKKKKIIIVNKD